MVKNKKSGRISNKLVNKIKNLVIEDTAFGKEFK